MIIKVLLNLILCGLVGLFIFGMLSETLMPCNFEYYISSLDLCQIRVSNIHKMRLDKFKI